MQKIVSQIYLFIKRNRAVLAILGVMTGLLHGDKLFSINSGIDTEKIIFAEESLYESWLGIGRQGLVLLKWIMGQLSFNPYFAGVLTLTFLVTAVAAFGFLFEAVSGKQSRTALLLFGGIVIAHPILTEQMYFTLQGAEVTLAFNLTAVSLYCAHRFACKRHLIWFAVAVILLIPTFGVYQAFVPLYMFGIISLGCLRLVNLRKADIQHVNKELLYVFKLCVVFLVAFMVNQVITSAFFTASDYLNKQIQWDFTQPVLGIRRILAHVRDVLLGNGVFYFGTFLWLACLSAIAFFMKARRKIGEKRWSGAVYIWGLALLAGLYISPFFLTILMGERPVIRGQLVLPFVMAYMTYLSYMLLAEDRTRKVTDVKFARITFRKGVLAVLVAISALTIWLEADITCRLYYTDAVRYQEDLQLAGWLEKDIAVFTNDCDYDGTVIFVGKRKADGNCASIKGDVMGQSLFAWDTDVEPKNYWSSSRIVGFMHCLGASYTPPNAKQVEQAISCAGTMACYPADGGIAWCKDETGTDMVVVKLSGE